MNKYQVVWLIIRLAGVYVAIQAVLSFFALVGSVPALFTLPKLDAPKKNANVNVNDPNMIRPVPINPSGIPEAAPEVTPAGGKSNDESITGKFTAATFTTFLWFLVITVIYGAIAWYLLRDGRILFAVLNRERPDGSEKEREPEVTTLNL